MAPLSLLVVAGLALYFMAPEERLRLVRRVVGWLRQGAYIAGKCRVGSDDPFYAYLRARTGWPLITYTLVAVCVAVFVTMVVSPGALGDPATLVAWGGNFGPRTTGGERWRVLTSIFVHRDVLHLMITVAAFVQMGLIVERIVGPFTFGIISVSAGVLGSIMTSAASPLSVSVGATGAVFGVYGLLFAAAFRGALQHSAFRMPLSVLWKLTPVAVIFVVYSLGTGDTVAAKTGLCTGVVGGIALTRSVRDYRARLRRFAVLGTATAAIVLMSAMALRAVTDVRPTVAAVVATEERIAGAYDDAVVQFKEGRITTKALAQVIEQTVAPDIQRARDRVNSLSDVSAADASLVADTQDYLRLRQESWRIRAEALRKGSMRNLMQADKTEQESLLLFKRVRSALLK